MTVWARAVRLVTLLHEVNQYEISLLRFAEIHQAFVQVGLNCGTQLVLCIFFSKI